MGCGDSRLQTNIEKQILAELGPIFQRRIHEIRRRRRIRKYTQLASGDDNNNITDNEVASSPVNILCLSVNNNNNCSSSFLSNIKTCPDPNARGEIDGDEKRVRQHEHERELIFAAGSPSFKVYLQEDHKNDDAVITAVEFQVKRLRHHQRRVN